MRSSLGFLIAVSCSCCFPRAASPSASGTAFPVCAVSRAAPVVLAETLPFCGYTGLSCCDQVDDAALRDEFESLNVSPDAGCTDIVKAILCEGCIPASSSLPPPPDPFKAAAESRIPPRCTSPPASSTSVTASPQEGAGTSMCLESIGVRGSSYLNMAAHPDGSNRAFFSTQDGKIWLASIPTPGSGDTLEFHDEDDSSPFLDLTGRVVELMGVAFHAEFAANGRFFVSYTCDTAASPACSGSSAAATRTDSSSSPSSQYQLIVAEFSVANKSKATRAAASEVRRLFTLGVPYTSSSSDQQQHGGQILFRRPSDGYLYLMTGHGGDHFDNDTASFLGKIIRFNIDSTINGQTGGTSASSRHSNNRSAGTSTTPMEEPEIFAVGLSNPRGCSFDSDRPSYLFCANVDDQQQYDSVYLIGGPFVNAASLVVGYGAHPVSSAGSPPSPSIVGGLVYRGSADPSLKGRYLYMYGVSAWAAVEVPASSGRYVSTQIPDIRCSPAVPCIGVGVDGRRVVSFGEDNNNDAFLLATGAIYRVVAPGLCHHAAAPHRWSSGLPWLLSFGGSAVVFAFYQIYMRMFSGGQAAAGNGCITCFFDSIVCSCCNTVTSIINGAPPAAGVAGQALQLGV